MCERDPLLDTSIPELFDAERPKHASAEAAWAAVAGRAIGAYAVAQAERDHLRRALAQVQADMDIFRGQNCEGAPKSVMMNLEAMQERVAAALAATEEVTR